MHTGYGAHLKVFGLRQGRIHVVQTYRRAHLASHSMAIGSIPPPLQSLGLEADQLCLGSILIMRGYIHSTQQTNCKIVYLFLKTNRMQQLKYGETDCQTHFTSGANCYMFRQQGLCSGWHLI